MLKERLLMNTIEKDLLATSLRSRVTTASVYTQESVLKGLENIDELCIPWLSEGDKGIQPTDYDDLCEKYLK